MRRGHYLRNFVYRFIELCNPELNESLVRNASSTAASLTPAPGRGEVFEGGGGI